MRLKDKVALITGAGSGIGRETALLFAEEGAAIAAADLTAASVQETVDAITSSGGRAVALTADVTSGADAEKMVASAVESFGKLDLLVNSAGMTSRHPSLEGASPEEVWERVIEVNLKGTYLVSWYAVPEMERTGSGSIINLASTMGLVGYPVGIGGGFNPYPPSKGGVVQFTKTLAVDSASKNIRVNCLCPGFHRDQPHERPDLRPGDAREAQFASPDGPTRPAPRGRQRRAVPRFGRRSPRHRHRANRRRRLHGLVEVGRGVAFGPSPLPTSPSGRGLG